MAQSHNRPLSPHLSIWKWGPHMLISILHRVTGDGMAIVGAIGIVWWLLAAASGKAAYDQFISCATSIPGYIVMIGLTWAFFQHLCSGLRSEEHTSELQSLMRISSDVFCLKKKKNRTIINTKVYKYTL